MTDAEVAVSLADRLGTRRAEIAVVKARPADRLPAVLDGYDKAVSALVELSLAAGWDRKASDAFWQEYDRHALMGTVVS